MCHILVVRRGWYIYIYIYHHIALVARISLTLSRHSSLSFIALGRSSGQQPVSSHSSWMYVRAGRPAFARPCVGVHKSTSLMSSPLLLQHSYYILIKDVNYWTTWTSDLFIVVKACLGRSTLLDELITEGWCTNLLQILRNINLRLRL